jgi:hypothetical protein
MLYLTIKSENQGLEIQRPIMAADGYLFLGMPMEALEELASIPVGRQKDPAVLRTRIRVLLHLRNWREAEKLSQDGARLFPSENEFMVQLAFALHQQAKGTEAVDVILSAPAWIRRSGILHYNLACYEAQLGDLGTARQCIRAACELNASFKKNARCDPDLQRLSN